MVQIKSKDDALLLTPIFNNDLLVNLVHYFLFIVNWFSNKLSQAINCFACLVGPNRSWLINVNFNFLFIIFFFTVIVPTQGTWAWAWAEATKKKREKCENGIPKIQLSDDIWLIEVIKVCAGMWLQSLNIQSLECNSNTNSSSCTKFELIETTVLFRNLTFLIRFYSDVVVVAAARITRLQLNQLKVDQRHILIRSKFNATLIIPFHALTTSSGRYIPTGLRDNLFTFRGRSLSSCCLPANQ